MIEKFNEEEYLQAHSEDFLLVECTHCGKEFLVIKKQITFERKHNKGAYRFCSPRCKNLHEGSIHLVKCEQCGKEFTKGAANINNTKHNFCCKSCAALYNNAHRNYGYTRSKLEVYIEQQLLELYPQLEMKFNDKTAIASELDIYIPQLHLAFELNGIIHYEPIYGREKLEYIQQRDENKFQLCHENNISLCIIDTSSQKYFNERSSQKYISLIKEIIDENLKHYNLM